MNRNYLLGALLVIPMMSAPFGLKTTLKKGDFTAIKDESAVRLEFTYDRMSVGKLSEEDYINKKRKEHNEKEAGKGDEWAGKWVAARANVYEPQFEELLNEQLAKHESNLRAGRDQAVARYFLRVHTTDTEPGWNIGISRAPGYVTASITLHESGAPDTALGEVLIDRAPARDAMGYDFDASGRIGEGYAKLGKELGAWLVKTEFGRKN